MTDYRDLTIRYLHLIAQSMARLCEVRSECVSFDCMSYGVIWQDEMPPLDQRGQAHSWGLRPVFGYRTSLILGQPDPSLEEYWTLAKHLFPEWVGFRPERCEPSAELAAFVAEESKRVTE